MCEFCGCGEPPYRSVAVVVPAVNDTEPATPAAVVAGIQEEEDEEEG
jgi:hypothetical protein